MPFIIKRSALKYSAVSGGGHLLGGRGQGSIPQTPKCSGLCSDGSQSHGEELIFVPRFVAPSIFGCNTNQ